MMEYWVTKYAATSPLKKMTLKPVGEDGDMRPEDNDWLWIRPGEYYENFAVALADAKVRRLRKITSLKKQISKVNQLLEDEA